MELTVTEPSAREWHPLSRHRTTWSSSVSRRPGPISRLRQRLAKGYDLYVPEESVDAFKDAGVPIAGTIKDMYGKVDIVVDCTPGNVGEMYKAQYQEAGVKAIFQGGDDHSLTGTSFNSTANYSESWGAQTCPVSCHATPPAC